jgi:CDP-glucose 4,6-dehydratase
MVDGAAPPGDLDRAFWRGRRVFMTGHTGFKGSWLSLWLQSLGADLTGFALAPPTEPNLFTQANVAAGMRSIQGDIRDYEVLKAAIAECKPEVVLHMAAQSVVKAGYADPIGTYASNVMGTVNLFEAVRRLGARCSIVNVTSDKCYDHREDGPPYRENDPMGGDDPYSNSKGCAELVTMSFRLSYFPPDALDEHGVGLASVRAGNVIGGGDWTAHQLIPDLIRAFVAGEPCPIRSPGGIRPWEFVLEPLRGYLMVAERLAGTKGGAYASGWNFGPDIEDAKPVKWIADHMVKRWGSGASWARDAGAHEAEAATLRLDITKATTELHWNPAMRLEQALDWIVEWYKTWNASGDVGQLTRAQIARYDRMLA